MGVGEWVAISGAAHMSMLLLEPAQGEGGARGRGEHEHRTQQQEAGIFTPQASPILSSPTRFIKFSPSVGSLPAPLPLPTPKAHSITQIGEILGQEEAGCG